MNIYTIVLCAFGLFLLLFATKITKLIFNLTPKSRFNTSVLRIVFVTVPLWAIGIMCFFSSFIISKSVPSVLKKDRDILLLFETGIITQGKVEKVFYQIGAPAGWKVIYEFEANKEDGPYGVYVGSSQGPKKFFNSLSEGSDISVIYARGKPELNCEIMTFLNHPGFRQRLKKKDKLSVLDRFRNEYKIENYTYRGWYSQQQDWKK